MEKSHWFFFEWSNHSLWWILKDPLIWMLAKGNLVWILSMLSDIQSKITDTSSWRQYRVKTNVVLWIGDFLAANCRSMLNPMLLVASNVYVWLTQLHMCSCGKNHMIGRYINTYLRCDGRGSPLHPGENVESTFGESPPPQKKPTYYERYKSWILFKIYKDNITYFFRENLQKKNKLWERD